MVSAAGEAVEAGLVGTVYGNPNIGAREQRLISAAMIALLATSFVLGGASRQHELRLALVELTALPLLALALMALLRDRAIARRHLSVLWLATAVMALPLVQLIPLPPSIWTALPGRDSLTYALELAGITPGWANISLTPDKTWRSFLALIPPLAMFLAVLVCNKDDHRRTILLLMGLTVGGILLGSAQLASGTQQLYPWRTTDVGIFAGFFANRNHMATLCLVCIPFAVLLGSRFVTRDGTRSRTFFWLSVLMLGLLVVTIGIIRSRAGIIILWPVLGASLVTAWTSHARGRPATALAAIIGAATIAVMVVGFFALSPILSRFDGAALTAGRIDNWKIVWDNAQNYLPLGAGIGSFDAVYRSIEPLERLDSTYFNQAHNEYLEIWLEAGLLGILLVVAFCVWFIRRSFQAWGGENYRGRDLQRAATIAIGAILIHSTVDYPLRTEALAVLFAYFCGLLEAFGQRPIRRAGRDDRMQPA